MDLSKRFEIGRLSVESWSCFAILWKQTLWQQMTCLHQISSLGSLTVFESKVFIHNLLISVWEIFRIACIQIKASLDIWFKQRVFSPGRLLIWEHCNVVIKLEKWNKPIRCWYLWKTAGIITNTIFNVMKLDSPSLVFSKELPDFS
jgi:hypothetical protein